VIGGSPKIPPFEDAGRGNAGSRCPHPCIAAGPGDPKDRSGQEKGVMLPRIA
jgi:hypothetical protein